MEPLRTGGAARDDDRGSRMAAHSPRPSQVAREPRGSIVSIDRDVSHSRRYQNRRLGISQKLHEKAYRYGQLDAPYLIAVWSLAMTAGSDDFQYALFGHWPQDSREDPGALWHRGGKPRATRVSAVIGGFAFTFGAPTRSKDLAPALAEPLGGAPDPGRQPPLADDRR